MAYLFCNECGHQSAAGTPLGRRRAVTGQCHVSRPGYLEVLSTQLDPKDYRELIRAYQDACTDVVKRRANVVV
jgi:hypothetical protein